MVSEFQNSSANNADLVSLMLQSATAYFISFVPIHVYFEGCKILRNAEFPFGINVLQILLFPIVLLTGLKHGLMTQTFLRENC